MNIILASSEVVPYAKTGGLADVCGALPQQLEKLGHQVSVFMPGYRSVVYGDFEIRKTGVGLEIPIGNTLVAGELLVTTLPGSNVNVYLVANDDYYDRESLYGEKGVDYEDNAQRFIFFSRAVLEAVRLLDLKPDIVHCNDWQTGLIPALLKVEYDSNPIYENISSVITIHNLAYQGTYPPAAMPLTGLEWKYFNYLQMEFFDRLNLLKTGIVFADSINTVSPTYAQEIQASEQGCGLEGVLQGRSDVLSGILNGIDVTQWNPADDPLIPTNFSADDWWSGKAACKAHLQDFFGLQKNSNTPLIGIVGRLAEQKGWSLILQVMQKWLESTDVQWVILGTGSPQYHAALTSLYQNHPHKLGLRLGFSNELAHQIEAGADMFVMPSQYEPCGLNQMYSMAYGTVPVVRKTGGLADTVVDASQQTIADQTANGFTFDQFTAAELENALSRAINMYRHDKENWNNLVNAGIKRDWSWAVSAKAYQRLYRQTLQRRQGQSKAT
jgi:starch synthase